MKDRWLLLAVIVPLAGLLVLVGRAELAVRSGPSWQVAIEGYDPRDLLHGRYLQYQFDFNWQGQDTCGSGGGTRSPSAGCCLCLSRTHPSGIGPAVHQVDCASVEGCDGWLRSDGVLPPLRFFVPEERAKELERALREREASMEFACTGAGRAAIRDLYLDGRPWRDALSD